MKSFADLDLSRLHEDWAEQPKLHRKYARKMPDAKRDLSEAKADLKVIIAEVKRAIRRNPKKYDVPGRATDNAVKEAAEIHPKVRRAETAIIEAAHVVDVLEAALNTLTDRKKTLENLVTLWSMSYFSEPRVKKGTEESVRDSLDRAEKRSTRNSRPMRK